MTVLVLRFLVLQAIPASAPLLLLPATVGYLASAAYIDNISSFFGHNSRYPIIRISGWVNPAPSVRRLPLAGPLFLGLRGFLAVGVLLQKSIGPVLQVRGLRQS